MLSVILFLVVLVVLVTVHELGHFWAARISGVKVDEFGIGLPPKAYGYKPEGSEVEYTLNWLPLGGFVKIFGEDYESTNPEDPDYKRSFVFASKPAQIFIMVAGVAMNFLIAVVLFTTATWIGVNVVTDDVANRDGFYVLSVSPDSPALAAGLAVGDRIQSISNQNVSLSGINVTNESFAETITNSTGEVTILLANGEEIVITPDIGLVPGEPDRRAIGVYADSVVREKSSFVEGVVIGWNQSVVALKNITVGFIDLISQVFSGNGKESFSNLAGPIGIAQMSSQAYQVGFASLLTFAAFLSLNLVVLNLLPFPALDGGRIVMIVAEAIKGSPLNAKFAGYLNLFGFALLLLLMLAVTIQDVTRLF